MNLKSIYKCIVLSTIFVGNISAQNSVSGIVIDTETKEPIASASIKVKNADNYVFSNNNGKFNLDNVSSTDSLVVSYFGYENIVVSAGKSAQIELISTVNNLDQLIVTANREGQNRTDAPIAISVLSKEILDDAKATSLDQILNKVNGVFMVNLGNEQHSMSMRQPLSYGSLFLYLEDGLPIRTMGVFNHNALIEMNMAAVNKIEVIKGPASSLYGSEAIGGAMNFITHKPSALTTAQIQLQGNNLGYKRTDFVASNTFNKFGVVASGYYANKTNGPIDHSDFNKVAVNLRGDYFISNKTTWTNTFSYIDYKTDMTGSLDSLEFFNQDFSSLHSFTERTVNALRYRSTLKHQWSSKSNTQFNLFFRDNTIGQIPSYRVKDDYKPWNGQGNPLLAHGEKNENAFKSFGGVVQHQQKVDFWNANIIAGASIDFSPNDYYAEYIQIDRTAAGFYTGYQTQDSLLANYDVSIINTAMYSQVQLNPIEKLKVTLSGRYDLIQYNYDNHLDSTAFSGAPDDTYSFNQITPKLGLTYDFGKGNGAYANYSVGFAPPEVSELFRGVTVPTLIPASYQNYELGGWISLLKNKIILEVSLYQLNGTNEIINVRQPDGSTEKENAGKTLHQGIEYTIRFNPISDLQIRFSGSNAEHLFIDFIENGNDYSNNEMNGAPNFIANAELMYKPSFLKGFRIGGEYQMLSAYYLDANNTEQYEGFSVFNARLGYEIKGFEFWFNTLNILDKYYAVNASKSAWGKNYRLGNPRTFNIGLAYKFNGKK